MKRRQQKSRDELCNRSQQLSGVDGFVQNFYVIRLESAVFDNSCCNDDREPRAHAAQRHDQIVAIHSRHLQVGDDQIGRICCKMLQGLSSIECTGHPEPAVLEHGSEQQGSKLLVFNYHDVRCWHPQHPPFLRDRGATP